MLIAPVIFWWRWNHMTSAENVRFLTGVQLQPPRCLPEHRRWLHKRWRLRSRWCDRPNDGLWPPPRIQPQLGSVLCIQPVRQLRGPSVQWQTSRAQDIVRSVDFVQRAGQLEETPSLVDPDVTDNVRRMHAGVGVWRNTNRRDGA